MGTISRRATVMKVTPILIACLVAAGPALAQVLDPEDAISRISGQDIAESLLSLNNFTASPGVEGGNLTVDFDDGQPNVEYGRVSIQIPIIIKTGVPWLNVYTEVGYGGLFVDDNFTALSSGGETLQISSDRNIDSGRFGLGVEFLPTPNLHIAPYVTGTISGLSSKTRVVPPDFDGEITPEEAALLSDWTAKAWSAGGVLDVQYLKWLREERNRLDLIGRYSVVWAETFDESLPILDSGGLRHTLVFEAVWRTLTDRRIFGKQVEWNVFTNSVSFPGQEKDDLGFTYYFGFGAGVDLYLPERLWGKIGRNFIGLRGSGMVGDDVHGWSIVLSLRN